MREQHLCISLCSVQQGCFGLALCMMMCSPSQTHLATCCLRHNTNDADHASAVHLMGCRLKLTLCSCFWLALCRSFSHIISHLQVPGD